MSNDVTLSCLDAERFAAWVDGGLPPSEAALVEAHLADCARCHAMMAAFALTDDAPSRPVVHAAVPWWRGGLVRWAVPLAAAAGVALWVAVSKSPEAPPPAQLSARLEAPPEPAVPAPASVAPPTQPASVAAAPRPPGSAEAPPPDQLGPTVQARDAFGTLKALPGAVDSSEERNLAAWKAGRELSISGGTSLNRNTTIDGVPVGEEGGNGRTYITPNIDSGAEANVVSSGSAADNARVVQFSSPLLASAPAPAAAASPVRGVAAGRGGGGGRGGPLAQTLWRVFADGRVERSLTRGASWELVTPREGVTITSGAAPSAGVCWLIGKQGVVLVSTDRGTTFSRVDIQRAPDLSAIQAVDHLQATVTAGDGRTFSTINGGASWQ